MSYGLVRLIGPDRFYRHIVGEDVLSDSWPWLSEIIFFDAIMQ